MSGGDHLVNRFINDMVLGMVGIINAVFGLVFVIVVKDYLRAIGGLFFVMGVVCILIVRNEVGD